jgi:capsular exopolysaccharide synthesis family protein
VTTTGAPADSASGSELLGGGGSGFGRSTFNDPSFQSSPLGPSLEDRSSGGVSGLVRTVKRRQGLFLFVFALVTGALAVDTLRQRIFSPVYQGGFQMQISNPFDENRKSQIDSNGGTVEQIARSSVQNDVPSLVVLLRSPLLIKGLAEKNGVGMNEVINNLSIAPASGDVQNVLNVTLRWRDPVKGRAILNQLSQEYTNFSLTQRQATLDSGVNFLDQQAPDLLSRVEKLQTELRTFRERNNFLEPATQGAAIQASRDGLVTELRQLQVSQAQLESQLSSVKAGRLQFNGSGAPTAVATLGPTSLATAPRDNGAQAAVGTPTPVQQLSQLEQDLATARATYRDDSPVVQSIKARRDQLLPVVQGQAVDSLRAGLLANAAQQDEINRQILLLNDNFRTSPRKIKEYEDVQQRLAVARDNYSSYIRARETFRLERARSTTPWQVIAPAEFTEVPVEPNIQRNLLRALVLGLLAGLGAAILRERTDNVFHTPMEAERDLQLPVLGLIPYLPLEPGVEISTSIAKMSASERFAIKESLRSLFTTFRLLRADRDIRLVGVTSSTQGEGKSTAVTIFARTLADLGLKVLIIDADMRLPMQNRYLGVEPGDGLSSLLSDPNIKPEQVIQTIQENLDVMPAGPKPPDPAKLLNSARCQEVVAEIRALPGYDIVLFDAPPCLMLADPILLGEKLDGILFLVGLGKVSRQLAPQAARRIKATGVDVLGLICNQVNFPSRLNDYGYEYGYYYHYAYASNYGSNRYSTYGKYGKGFMGYVKRYRDSYVNNRYRDSYMTKGASGVAGRLRDGNAVQRYQDAAVSEEARLKREAAEAVKGSDSAPDTVDITASTTDPKGSGRSGNWLRDRLRPDSRSNRTPDDRPDGEA